MLIDEARKMKKELEEKILVAIQEFENSTGMEVESID